MFLSMNGQKHVFDCSVPDVLLCVSTLRTLLHPPRLSFECFDLLLLFCRLVVLQVDCSLSPADVELILMPCDSEFEDLTFQLGWQQFTLTVSLTLCRMNGILFSAE